MTGPRLLVVDDDPGIREALAGILEDEGYAVETAVDGVDALARLRSEASLPTIDAILLDVMMPRMNGFEFREAQLGDPALATIPVIVLTAGRVDERARALSSVGCLRKPIDLDALLALVAGCTRGP